MASGLLIGLGIGMNNNTYLVAVQSESAWNQRGIATSALMFCRILGQAIGAAAFGGILNASLARYLKGGERSRDADHDAGRPRRAAGRFRRGDHRAVSITRCM